MKTVKIQPSAVRHLINMVAEFEATFTSSSTALDYHSIEFLEDYVDAVEFLRKEGVTIGSPRRVIDYLNRNK